ncbi:hypothetical protein DAEQUDRAFT_536249 [Daedalea quercina L-15889]|uniref:Uncharacterized protein n=1 Tax=Daedalea quercina L-15889 TaxID=1314783 RepID=A0A165M4V3_9APHY|nr:hypothetical protein DAEQUDRAFT_536249 [Daedalea quercina L-15889]
MQHLRWLLPPRSPVLYHPPPSVAGTLRLSASRVQPSSGLLTSLAGSPLLRYRNSLQAALPSEYHASSARLSPFRAVLPIDRFPSVALPSLCSHALHPLVTAKPHGPISVLAARKSRPGLIRQAREICLACHSVQLANRMIECMPAREAYGEAHRVQAGTGILVHTRIPRARCGRAYKSWGSARPTSTPVLKLYIEGPHQARTPSYRL